MENQLSLRPATPDDLPIILEIEQKTHAAPWTQEHFQLELSKPYSHFLVMTDDETDSKIAGYIILWTLLDECQILNIVVDPPYQRKGLAKQMIRKSVQLAFQKNILKIVLDVRKSNLPAIQLYQSLHFVITHIRKGFYSNGEDAYQMTLSLKEDPFQF